MADKELESYELFLINILHQTATGDMGTGFALSCSLSIFYIKPQRMRFI